MTPVQPPCVFCEIAADRAPARVERRWPDALIIHPLNLVTTGHLLVLPVRHEVTAASDPDLAGRLASYAASWVAEHRWQANLIVNIGPEASQTVPHLHWHIVPRRSGDGLALPWPQR